MKNKYDKLVMNIPCEINKRYKEMASSLGVPKTYLITTALLQYLDSKEAISILSKFIEKEGQEENQVK